MKKLTLNVLIATLVLSLLSFVCVIGFANAQTTPAAYDGSVTVYKDASNDLYLADGEGRTAVVLSLDAEYGASAKTVDGSGIRFVTNVDKAGYDALGDAKDKVSFGTLIGPADLNTSNIVHKSNSSDYLDVAQKDSWYEKDGDYHFNGALLYDEETKVSAYSRAQAGRGYMAIQTADNGTVYVYAKIAAKLAGDLYESNVRSVSYVMSNAFENGMFNGLGVEEQNALKKFLTVGDFEDVARSFNVVKGAWTSLTDDASITSDVLDGDDATSLTDVKFADVNDSFTVTVGGVEYSVNANGTVSVSNGLALDMTAIDGFDIAKTYTVRAVADDAGVSLWINDGDTCVFIDKQETVEVISDNVVVLEATKDVVLSNVSISNVAELGSKNEVVLEEQSFEVYQKLSDLQAKNTFDALTANTLTVDLGSNVNSATAMLNETAIAVNVSGDTVSIDGAQFGSKIYGKQTLVVDTPLTVYTQPLNIVTKYITDFTDLYNIMCYGGWATRDMTDSEVTELGANGGGTCYTYGGYFLQTNDFNIAYNCTPRFRPHLNETDKITNKLNGFTGVYDGGNYTIGGVMWQYKTWKSLDGVGHDFIGLGNSGLFGNVAESGKIQNLNINVEVGSGGNNQRDMGIIAKTFCGTLENVSIVAKCTNNGLCTYATNPIATFVAEATLTNVSIALDMSATTFAHNSTTSILGSWYLMGKWSTSYKCQNALTLSNVHTYVKVSEFNTPILYKGVAWVNGGWGVVDYALSASLNGVTQHEYNSANTTLPDGLDANVWEINAGVPRLRAAN